MKIATEGLKVKVINCIGTLVFRVRYRIVESVPIQIDLLFSHSE